MIKKAKRYISSFLIVITKRQIKKYYKLWEYCFNTNTEMELDAIEHGDDVGVVRDTLGYKQREAAMRVFEEVLELFGNIEMVLWDYE